jgi:hypothetical protein
MSFEWPKNFQSISQYTTLGVSQWWLDGQWVIQLALSITKCQLEMGHGKRQNVEWIKLWEVWSIYWEQMPTSL